MKHFLLLIVAISLQLSLFSQEAGNKEILNLIENSVKLNGTGSTTQNKFVLLDFWATWCGPCIAALPDLEKLQHQYKDQLTVISVSDEQPEKVQRYLAGKNYNTTSFVCDTAKKLFQYFGVTARPQYVLLSPAGTPIWTDLLEKLDSLLPVWINGSPLPDALKRKVETVSGTATTPALFSLRYNITQPGTEFKAGGGIKDSTVSRATMQNIPFLEVVEYFTNVYLLNIISKRPDLDSLKLDLEMRSNQTNRTAASVRAQVMACLQQSFNFKADSMRVVLPGYELSVLPDLITQYRDDTEGGGMVKWKDDSAHFWRLSPEWIAETIGNRTNLHIVAQAGISQERYTFAVPNRSDFSGFVEALSKVGVILKKKDITVTQVVVR